ncbi:glyoxylate reductase/hydroxypyruvate reductase-like [Tubulanus polymorphus]|uniref:glyoxylate reductase/hydroxypyruvate reductase-like n=1 Tax=Tubulanus polymorphus TaxID=672921 RepID=UPI003DA4828C
MSTRNWTGEVKPCVLMIFTGCRELREKLRKNFKVVCIEEIIKKKSEVKREDIVAVVTASECDEPIELYENILLYTNLKVLTNFGAGVNHIDIKFINSHGVKVANTPGVVSDATADMAMTLMLASARNLYLGITISMDKTSSLDRTSLPVGVDVCYATLGIVGMGSIGYEVACRAKSCKMKIYYHNRKRRSIEDENAVGATYCDKLHDMLPLCDFIIITCPLLPETKHMISEPEFKAMKRTATVINVARGGVINHDALYEALTSNQIRGAALDVTDPEPLPKGHKLRKLPNLIVVPHMGIHTVQTRKRMQDLVIKNLEAALSGQPLPSEVLI